MGLAYRLNDLDQRRLVRSSEELGMKATLMGAPEFLGYSSLVNTCLVENNTEYLKLLSYKGDQGDLKYWNGPWDYVKEDSMAWWLNDNILMMYLVEKNVQ